MLNHVEPDIRTMDALCVWFTDATASRLARWRSYAKSAEQDESDTIVVALFRLTRKLSRSFEGSNPTWVRRARTADQKISLEDSELDRLVHDEIAAVNDRRGSSPKRDSNTLLVSASAQALPLAIRSADVILGSPPYLTRIDYAVAYSRELAVLGENVFTDRRLRASLTGTTLIRTDVRNIEDSCFGDEARRVLRNMSVHGTKDANGYYRKQLLQYLDDSQQAVRELTRVATDSAAMHLVVQDSYFKDIPISLSTLLEEEATQQGWRTKQVTRFDVRRSLTTLNKAAKAYAKDPVREAVITFEKDAR